ncbi:uncharacterized protein LOC126635236 [Myiozetetes cayanensis]|uniref:uncharacterized protein LOC126635236 n=1 Tax=Myiozetetes cayanensis TaxID=478635 RepID=UPI00216107E5|nr:uncharacterized protein LOC126635236 [Myiozetetes cayanensis]
MSNLRIQAKKVCIYTQVCKTAPKPVNLCAHLYEFTPKSVIYTQFNPFMSFFPLCLQRNVTQKTQLVSLGVFLRGLAPPNSQMGKFPNSSLSGELTAEIDQLTASLEERDRRISKLTSDLGESNTKLKERDRKITKLAGEVRRLTALVAERDSGLRKLRSELAKCDSTIRLFTVELGERHTKIGELTADVECCNKKLREHEAELEARDTQIRRLKEQLGEQDAVISKLREELEENGLERGNPFGKKNGKRSPKHREHRETLGAPELGALGALGALRDLQEQLEELRAELGGRDARIGACVPPPPPNPPESGNFGGNPPGGRHQTEEFWVLPSQPSWRRLWRSGTESWRSCRRSWRIPEGGSVSVLSPSRGAPAPGVSPKTKPWAPLTGFVSLPPPSPAGQCLEEHRKEEEQAAWVTLDPGTSHPWLALSGDGRSARWAYGTPEPPASPERFQGVPCVLGLPEFRSGRHSWSVELGGGPFCAVGVSRGSLRRRGPLAFSPRDGVWALQRWGGGGRALTEPPTPLARLPRRLRVALDYEGGRVAFFDGDGDTAGTPRPLFAFPRARFGGEALRPWFWLELGTISLVP